MEPIATQEEYEAALAEAERLWDAEDVRRLSDLADRIIAWEREHYAF